MRRYLVERTLPDRLLSGSAEEIRETLRTILSCHSDRNVTWIHSYVDVERSRSYCIYHAANPEVLRLAAMSAGLEVDRIAEITSLDPYPYPGG